MPIRSRVLAPALAAALLLSSCTAATEESQEPTPTDGSVSALAHDPGEVRSSCRAVTRETLAWVGMEDLHIDPPTDCWWVVNNGSGPVKALSTRVQGYDGESHEAADTHASEGMRNVRGQRSDIADEAVVTRHSGLDHMTSSVGARLSLVARQDNVLISVDLHQWGGPEVAQRFGVGQAEAEAGVLAALGDVLAELGVDRPAKPGPSDPGRFTSTNGLCGALADEAVAVANAPLTVHRRDSRRIWCTWGDLVVTAEAARGSILTNDDAADMAAHALGREDGRRIRGIGRGAKVADERLRDGNRRVLTVQFDNLVVGVSQAMPAGSDRPGLDARARTLALAARDALR